MAKIVIAPYGSLGDLHPFLAIAIELRKRGHSVTVASLEAYREKVETLGVSFCGLRPAFDPEDRDTARLVMDSRRGTERLIRDYLLPGLFDMYDDLMVATEGADLLIPGEIAYAARSVVEKRKLPWITTSLAPLSMFSTYEPNIYPNAQFLQYLNFIGRPFHRLVFFSLGRVVEKWLEPYREFRRDLGLSDDHDPIVKGKFSTDLHLALFSAVLGAPQPDWHKPTVQTGFCFYDGGQDIGTTPEGLDEFLSDGEPPLVFTLGSAAVMDAGDFFEQSIGAAKKLGRRALALYGIFNKPPEGIDDKRVAFDYAPFGELFPRAACVVHQGGVGTTSQVLRAGVPHLIMPFSHDQPDNAARCVRLGVARTISREEYGAAAAAEEIRILLGDLSYRAKASEVRGIIASEDGTTAACDEIERVLEGR